MAHILIASATPVFLILFIAFEFISYNHGVTKKNRKNKIIEITNGQKGGANSSKIQMQKFIKKIAALMTVMALSFPELLNAQTNQTIKTVSAKLDSIKDFRNEIGISTVGYQYRAFAPEWYMQGFGFDFSPGIFFRKQIYHSAYKTTYRISYKHSNQTIKTTGGRYPEGTSDTGKGSGFFISAGMERFIYVKKSFRFYGGADMEVGKYDFNGMIESYDGCVSFFKHKKMSGMGLNPFAGCSVTVLQRIKISVESSFNIWGIREKEFVNDPQGEANRNRFVCSPNPLNNVFISFLF